MSEQATNAPVVSASDGHAPEQEHHDPPYYKILGVLTALTAVELFWPVWFPQAPIMLILGLSVMAGAKALLVAMYYMHLKFESKVLWFVMAFPVILAIIMVAGFLPDAVGYHDVLRPQLP